MRVSGRRRDFLRHLGLGGTMAAATTTGVFSARPHARAAVARQVTLSQWSPPSTFNVLTAADQYAYQDIALMFASLTRLDDALRPLPELAQSWDVSKDGLIYTFHLNPKAKWHDGQQVTAADVDYTFNMIANRAIPAGSYSSFSSIQGFAEVNAGKLDKVSGIRVVDAGTVEFTLTNVDVTFLSADSDDAARPVQDDGARCSEIMPPTWRVVVGAVLIVL